MENQPTGRGTVTRFRQPLDVTGSDDATTVNSVDTVAAACPSDEKVTARTGSLFDPDATVEVDAATTTEAAESPVGAESETAAEEGSGDDVTPAAEAEECEPARLRAMRRRAAVVLIVAAALFVGAAGFAGATAQPYLNARATVAIKERVAATAADALTTLWTYTPADVDSLPARAGKYLAGDLAVQYRELMGTVVPQSKQLQVTKRTVVVGAAVEALSENEATVVVYTNQTSSSTLTNDIPKLSYWSYQVTLQREGRDWLVNNLYSITTLDLTPQL